MPEFAATFDLSTLDGTNGFRVAGTVHQFSAAGDVNGDGIADISMAAKFAANPTFDYHYVVFGSAQLPATISVKQLESGVTGFTMASQSSKWPDHVVVNGVGSLGDVNGDGFDDVFTSVNNSVGTEFYAYATARNSIRFGSANPADANNFGQTILSFYDDQNDGKDDLGSLITSAAGDFDGDGFADVLSGLSESPLESRIEAGQVLINFGSPTGDLTRTIKFTGIGANDQIGRRIAGGGDINGDGYDDIVIGSYGSGTYVVFGSRDPSSNTNLSFLQGQKGTHIIGTPGDNIVMLGDVNADGFDDIGIDNYVIYGRTYGFGATLDLSLLNSSSFIELTNGSGAIAKAGDVNGDGFDDIILGKDVIFGRGDFTGQVDVSRSLDGNHGFSVAYTSALSGLKGAGDVNGDGLDDLIAGTGANAFVIYGHIPDVAVNRTGTNIGQDIYGSEFADTVMARGGDDVLFGNGGADKLYGEAGNDRLRGDEGDDRLDGGAGMDTATYASAKGAVTVNLAVTDYQTIGADQGRDRLLSIEGVIGSRFDDTLTGSAAGNRIDGGSGADTITGAGGHDTLSGNTGNDTIFGNTGNDKIEGGLGSDRLDGGAGIDTLVYSAGTIVIDLAKTGPQATGGAGIDTIANFENVTTGTGNDTLTGNALANTLIAGWGNDTLTGGDGNDILFGNQDNDTLFGNRGDDTLSGGLGRDILTGGAGRDTFVYAELAASTAGANRDRILDFVAGSDRIDLAAIDANTSAGGEQAFLWIGTADFTAAGQLRMDVNASGDTIVRGDTNGDKIADFEIQLSGRVALTAGDFIL